MVDKVKMTAKAFFDLPESMLPQELIHGELIVSPAPIPNHQRAVFRLAKLLETLIPDGEVLLAPLDVYFDDENIVQPDVIWIAENSQCKIEAKYLRGAPDLVIEVHSPGTVWLDKSAKFSLYEKHGVREYWMIDLEGQLAEIWFRQDNRFQRLGVFRHD